jgi:flagellar hook-basal body complex protein FliE
MDGLRISNRDMLIDQGMTTSEIRNSAVPSPQSPKTGNADGGFAETLKKAINSVNDLQKNADVQAQKLATGKSENIHDVMIAAEKADIAFKLMVQMRNKIIEAYQEVMKMQV